MLDNFSPEWRVALFLSQDKVGIAELLTGIDLHTDNQNRFKLGEGKEGRLVAKTFLFRLKSRPITL